MTAKRHTKLDEIKKLKEQIEQLTATPGNAEKVASLLKKIKNIVAKKLEDL
jgi:hypothetical protein